MAFAGVVHILWTMNSCINPLIYASTVPSFKEFIKRVFRRNDSCKTGKRVKGTSQTTEDVNGNPSNNIL